MISKSPITLADARRFSIGSDPVTWTRLIITFDQISNAASQENPRWVRDGAQDFHVHTFPYVPSQAEVEAKVDEMVASHEALTIVRLRYLGHEVCTGSALSAKERQDVEYARQIPDQYRDTDLLFMGCGPLVGGDRIRPWAPKAYARAVLAARDAGLADMALEAA